MATTEKDVTEVGQRIRNLAAELREHRGYPCLLFVSRHLIHADVLTGRRYLGLFKG